MSKASTRAEDKEKLAGAAGSRRTRARRQALQMLFTQDFVDGGTQNNASKTQIKDIIAHVMDDVVLEDYACELFDGVAANIAQIDDVISQTSDNWSIWRMPPTDRGILRIAVYELMFMDEVPSGVSINEAVELARDFGAEDESYKFVNGVLGKIARQLESENTKTKNADTESIETKNADTESE